MIFHLVQFLAYIPGKIIYPCKIYGKKNLKKGKAVLTMNHTSNIDAVNIVLGTFEKKYFLAKKELFKNKLFGAFIKAMGAIKIDRAAADVGAIKNALKVLKNDKKLIIFPEGTRNKSDNVELGEVKSGAAMLAIKAKAPIVPVWVYNRPHAFRMTKILIGEPYELSQFYGAKITEEILNQASEIVSQKLNELKQQAEEKFNKRKKTKWVNLI